MSQTFKQFFCGEKPYKNPHPRAEEYAAACQTFRDNYHYWALMYGKPCDAIAIQRRLDDFVRDQTHWGFFERLGDADYARLLAALRTAYTGDDHRPWSQSRVEIW